MRTLLLLLVSLVAARAELPPGAYERLQQEAPEALKIEVEEVLATSKSTTPQTGAATLVTAKAKVLAVERSASGLKEGVSITIRYEILPPMPGPRRPPVLVKGSVLRAFLRPGENATYGPAAFGMSFVSP